MSDPSEAREAPPSAFAERLVFAQLNRSACKTYLVACRRTGAAMLVDPLLAGFDRVTSLAGGMEAWHAAGLPVDRVTHGSLLAGG